MSQPGRLQAERELSGQMIWFQGIKGVETPLSQAEHQDIEILKIRLDRCKPGRDHIMIFLKKKNKEIIQIRGG